MKTGTDKNLKAVISLFREVDARETMKPKLKEAFTRQVMELRRALRTRDSVKTKKAVDSICRLFLRTYDDDQSVNE